MEKLTARSYINKKIQSARTEYSDAFARKVLETSGKHPVVLAQDEAWSGFPTFTASYLNYDTTTSILRKGEILAMAYTTSARIIAASVAFYSPRDLAEARRSEKIAQGLTRATQRSETS